jgi:hypothetical protein
MGPEKVPNRNAQVIIPFAIGVWLLGVVAFTAGLPPIFEVLFVVAFAVAVPLVVFYLMSAGGWRQLARPFRAEQPYSGEWVGCATGQMAIVSVDHPQFNQVKMRFVGGSLRVASTVEALHLKTIFTRLPLLGMFVPELRIPWSRVTRAREFEAPGWFAPLREPGTLLQVAYDPNYTGTFIELEAGEPTVYIQLPETILGEGLHRLPGIA